MSDPTPSEQSYIVTLCQGQTAEGKAYWAYLQLYAGRAKAFKQARQSGQFHLQDYGEILEWGYGEAVPTDVMQRMENDHGVNHSMEAQLLERLRAQRRTKKRLRAKK